MVLLHMKHTSPTWLAEAKAADGVEQTLRDLTAIHNARARLAALADAAATLADHGVAKTPEQQGLDDDTPLLEDYDVAAGVVKSRPPATSTPQNYRKDPTERRTGDAPPDDIAKVLHKTVDEIVTVPFIRNYIDTMCIFCGFPAKGAMTAHILYILERFFEEGCAFCVPLGGTVEMAYAFQRALEKRGGELSLNTHVGELLYDKDKSRCVGVKLKNGKVIKAKKAVVSNATPFDTIRMLPDGGEAPELPDGVREWKKTLGKLPRHGAIMHLFIAIDATDLDLSHIDDPAHLVVQVACRRPN